ncbi:MAG: hypothetical protein IJR22_07610 [Acidaminococcaceae bacterium]|nr:hypothetical protein [Acidaminococcaceae bacterium]
MSTYRDHYWKLEIYKQNFERMLNWLQSEKDPDSKLEIALCAANYFVYHITGYFTSSVLEEFFVKCAKSIKTDLTGINYENNSILHILTEGYKTGGHTRVVERWIENAPSFQKHSVVLTRPNKDQLITLEMNVKEKNGDFIPFDNKLSLQEKAEKLRRLAMKYEYVILHIHMEDPIAIMAFGSEDFTRPVLFYNHASHMPWLGKSIADLVLEIQQDYELTKDVRGITNTFFLGVPSKEIAFSISDKQEERIKLGMPVDKKIIVSCGSKDKFRTILDKGFIDYVKDIIDKDTYCYVIGVNPSSSEWAKAKHETNNHILPLKHIDFDKGFLSYLRAADLYLDSFPVGGGTAVMDAVSVGTPALSLQSVGRQFDYLITTSAFCKSGEEFVKKAIKVLDDKNYANAIFEELKNSLIKYQSIEAWNKRIKELFEIAPKHHTVKNLSIVKDYSEPCDLAVLFNVMDIDDFMQPDKIKVLSDSELIEMIKFGNLYKRQGIPNIFQVLSYKKPCQKTKILKLLNVTVYKRIVKSDN